MSRSYENSFTRKMTRAEALKESQRWLQTLRIEKAREFLNEILKVRETKNHDVDSSYMNKVIYDYDSLIISEELYKYLKSLSNNRINNLIGDVNANLILYEKRSPNGCPFGHPFYWEGFIIMGNSE